MKKNKIFRIFDANLNRAREGIRVCEDIMRFYLNDPFLSRAFKEMRHRLAGFAKTYPVTKEDLLKYRNPRFDVGRNLNVKTNKKCTLIDLFLANIQRTEEAVRVLEEISQIFNPKMESRFRRLRFRLYYLESKAYRHLVEHAGKRL